jgi:hypothetical protein
MNMATASVFQQKLYIPDSMAHSLQIESEEKHLGARRTAILHIIFMGKTCAGSEHSKNLGRLGPRGIVVDKTPVL